MSENTKKVILQVALDLFAKKGYQGTSIRDISNAADVNVASINYHFGSKESLFQEVIIQSMIIMDEGLKEVLGQDNITLSQAAWEMYKTFIEHESSMLSLFRVLFLEQVEFPNSPITLGKLISPPGGEYLFKIIQRESGCDNIDAVMWGVHVMSAHIIHSAIMLCSAFGKQKLANQPFYREDFKQQSLEILAHSILKQISNLDTPWPTCYKDVLD